LFFGKDKSSYIYPIKKEKSGFNYYMVAFLIGKEKLKREQITA